MTQQEIFADIFTRNRMNLILAILILTCSMLLQGCMGHILIGFCKIYTTIHPLDKTDSDYIKLGKQAEYRDDHDKAAEYYSIAIKMHPSVTSYSSLASVYQIQGRYRDAISMKKRQAELERDPSDPGQCPQEMGDMYLEIGMYDDAKKCYDNAISAMRVFDKNNPHPYGYSHAAGLTNVCYAKYHLWTGDYEVSKQYQEDLLNEMRDYRPMPAPSFDIANQENILAMDMYFLGEIDEAEKISEHAAKSSGMFTEFYVTAVTMLGRIEEHRNDYNAALSRYKSGLDALENKTRPDYDPKVEKSALWGHIARAYYKSGNTSQAHIAYREAAKLRLVSGTHAHPDYADTLRQLAELLLTEGDVTSATLQAEQSLKVLDTALVPSHPRTSPTLIALSSIYELTGKSEKAAPLNGRIETILQKPLGPSKEDFMETAAFYTKILKKSGKTAAAAHLEKLRARQER